MKILVKEEVGYIKGYGRISDAIGNTRHGLSIEQHDLFIRNGFEIIEEWEEDKNLPPHVVGFVIIPKGTQRVYIQTKQQPKKEQK